MLDGTFLWQSMPLLGNLSTSQIAKESSETDPKRKNRKQFERWGWQSSEMSALPPRPACPPPEVHALRNAKDSEHAGVYSQD